MKSGRIIIFSLLVMFAALPVYGGNNKKEQTETYTSSQSRGQVHYSTPQQQRIQLQQLLGGNSRGYGYMRPVVYRQTSRYSQPQTQRSYSRTRTSSGTRRTTGGSRHYRASSTGTRMTGSTAH